MAISATYVSNTQFMVSGNRTANLPPTLRIQFLMGNDGTVEGTVAGASYDSDTDRTNVMISESILTGNLTHIKPASVYADDGDSSSNLPPHTHTSSAGGGVIPAAAASPVEIDLLQSLPIPVSEAEKKFLRINESGDGYELFDLMSTETEPGLHVRLPNTVIAMDGQAQDAGGKVLSGTADQVTVSHTDSQITIGTPQDINTHNNPEFAGITLSALTGILQGRGTAAVEAVAASEAFQVLRRNAANDGYEFAGLSLKDNSDVDAAASDAPILGDLLTFDGTKWNRLAQSELDGDRIDIAWNPSHYTPDDTIAEADDIDDLAAHLKGIDDAIGGYVGGGEANTASNHGGGVALFKQKTGVDFEMRTLDHDQFSQTGDVISIVATMVGPDYTPPAIKFCNSGEITIPAGRYYRAGWRLDGQYRDMANMASFWDVETAFNVDVDDPANMTGGAAPDSWYSVFMTGPGAIVILPFIRVNTVAYDGTAYTQIHPAEHRDGVTDNNTFVNADDCFNDCRLVLLTMGAFHGTIFTIADTVNGSPDSIKISNDVSTMIASTEWLQMLPPAGTPCLYLGCIRLESDGTLKRFHKTGWTYQYDPHIEIAGNAAVSPANTEIGKAVPPTSATMAFSYYAGQSGGNGIASVDLQVAYGLDGAAMPTGKGYFNIDTWDSYKRYTVTFPGLPVTAVSKLRNCARGWSNVPNPDSWVACDFARLFFWGFGE